MELKMIALGTTVKTPYVRIEIGDIYDGVGVIVNQKNWLTGIVEDHIVWQDGQCEALDFYKNPLFGDEQEDMLNTIDEYFLEILEC
tara:strand:+ start:9 stop:266 length:258 start_codon:yes stop_codon:yes gene_type:complete